MDLINCLDLDFDILKRISQDKLIRILEDEANGSKNFIIDSDLMKLLDRIANANVLRTHGVEKIFRLERIPPLVSCDQIVYFVQPSLHNVKIIIDHIKHISNETPMIYRLICVPRITFAASRLIEEEGLCGLVTIHEFWSEFIPIDNDFLSLELISYNRSSLLNGDFSDCLPVARALNTIHSLYGPFALIASNGRASTSVASSLESLIKSRPPQTKRKDCKMSHVIVLDRDIDFVSPLLTQLTYEGSLDEHYGVRAGVVDIPEKVTGKPLKAVLNSKDTIFDSIRNKHFGGVSSHLVKKARSLQERKNITNSMTPSEMKDFVTNDLKTLQDLQKSLSLHISACEGITKFMRSDFDMQLLTEHGLVTGSANLAEAKNYILDCMARQIPSFSVLRLICLYSITQRGISIKEYEFFAENFVKSYGYSHLLTFHRLKQMGLLLTSDVGSTEEKDSSGKPNFQGLRQVVSSFVPKKSNWSNLAKKFDLIPEADQNIDLHNPTHMSYVFNGAYTPLIPKLVSEILQSKSVDYLCKMMKFLPGESVISSEDEAGEIPRVALVLVLGGVTYAEVASIRLLAAILNFKIIIASTSSITGKSLVNVASTNS